MLSAFSRFSVAAAALLVCLNSSAGESTYYWYVAHFALGKMALVLDDASKTVTLKSGWRCEVGALSSGPNYESRDTVCRKRGEEVSFTVQCNQDHTNDHAFVGLKSGSTTDYIEVSCELPQRPAA